MYKIVLVLLLILGIVGANNIYATGLAVGGVSEMSFLPTVLIMFFFTVAAYIILRGVQKNK